MTTTPAPPFPIADLVTCAKCGNQATLNKDPKQQYHCYLSCSMPIRARELNAYLIPKITSAVITETTFPALKDRVNGGVKVGRAAGRLLSNDDQILYRPPVDVLRFGHLLTGQRK